MASSVSLKQLSHCFFSNAQTQVPLSLSLSLHILHMIHTHIRTQLHMYVNSLCFSILILVCIYMKQFKDLKHGWSPRSRYYSTNDTNISIQPIKAAANSPPFPLFQSTKVEESASEVKTHLGSYFRFLYILLGPSGKRRKIKIRTNWSSWKLLRYHFVGGLYSCIQSCYKV